VYERACTSCHAADLHGDENAEVPALVGDSFDRSWRGEPLSALFDKASKTMPADRPGALTPAEYADIIAYLLQANRLPPGADELRPDPAALRALIPPLAKGTP
jgi:mono/diheme cytochrome c family protein